MEPLIDDLLKLWDGLPLIEGSSEVIRAVLLTVAADLPAIRKVAQFLGHKANLGCSRCKFTAQREPRTSGASGRMCYYTPSPSEKRSHEEVVRQAHEYKLASSKRDARMIATRNGVRYSELVRLPYFDMVRMVSIDPMHTFLLGMVKRETMYNLEQLTPTSRHEFLRRLKSIKLPYDVGRLPSNLFDDEDNNGLGSATAQQWKNYIVTFARPCLYKLIPERAYKSIVLLAQIVTMIASPILALEDISHLEQLLHYHHKLFRQVYGKWSVTINYHMALHLPDIILDLGPPHAFWCFSYERMNGILAGTPNSNRCVELDVLDRYLCDFAFTNADILSQQLPNTLKEALTDEELNIDSYPQMFWVLSFLRTDPAMRFACQQQVDKGEVANWPIKYLHPTKTKVKAYPEFLKDLHTFFEDVYGNSVNYISPRISKYGRCWVNGQKFSSEFNSTERGSVVKAMFVDTTNNLIPYFGVVKYYFTAIAIIDNCVKVHHLAYMTWIKFRSDDPEPLSQLYMVTNRYFKADRIISPRRFINRCVLVPPKADSSYYFVSEMIK